MTHALPTLGELIDATIGSSAREPEDAGVASPRSSAHRAPHKATPRMSKDSDYDAEGLVYAIHAGDMTAEDVLVRRFRPGLVAIARAHGAHAAQAEDIAQDTLIVVIERLRKRVLDKPKQLAAFCRRVCRYVQIGMSRAAAVKRYVDDEHAVESAESDEENPEDAHFREVICEEIRGMLAELSERDRDVLRRKFLHGEPTEVTMESLGLSRGQYHVIVHRALRRMRDILERWRKGT